MVALTRLPSLMYSSTARILSSYEYMNYLLVVQVFVRTPPGQFCVEINTIGVLLHDFPDFVKKSP